MDEQEKLLTIQQLSLKLRIPKPTLRYWEKEFEGILVPLRTEGGQRRYSVENITRVEQIKKLKEKGMSLAEIRRKLSNSQEVNKQDPGSIACLADRIAEVVKEEIHRFLERGEAGLDHNTMVNKNRISKGSWS